MVEGVGVGNPHARKENEDHVWATFEGTSESV